MEEKPVIVIVGPGVVGKTLAILADKAGYRIAGIAARDPQKAKAAADAINQPIATGTLEEITPLGTLVFLTVSDDAIEDVCKRLSEQKRFSAGAVVAHCSGALSSEILSSARELCHAHIGSMHPLQTFPNVEAGLERLPGAYCFCEGDDVAVKVLEEFSSAIGAKPVRINNPEGKLLYHASAVMACNYFTALLDAAITTAQKAGINPSDALSALEPLVRATLDNIFANGPAKALTGPIARGDEKLIAKQFKEILAADKDLAEIYSTLGKWTVKVALEKGTIDEEKAESLRKLLSINQ